MRPKIWAHAKKNSARASHLPSWLVKQNHREYCSEQFNLHSGRLLRFLRRLGGGANSEDLLQELFVRFIRQTEISDLRGRELPWLYRVARNLVIDTLRKSNRELPLGNTEVTAQTSEDAGIFRAQILAKMFEVADRMGERYSLLLHLLAETKLSQSEMAAILGISTRSIRRMTEQLNGTLSDKLKDWREFID
jgi:RNA polymerase sigma factor (sigma-70 family)